MYQERNAGAENVDEIQEFRYLGSQITTGDGKSLEGSKQKIAQRNQAFN